MWIFLLALGIRLTNLTYHSLWFDEVMSTFWAAKPAGEIWRVGMALVQDKHPPLYYLLLHSWMLLFGTGDAAVRALGAVIGALAILPAYGIGRRLGGRRAGIFAGLLLALNPFLVWYGQEARRFMPATTFALAGLYGVLLLGDARDMAGEPSRIGRPLAGAFLVVAGFLAALYSYLYSALALPVAAVWLLLLWWLNRKRRGAQKNFWLGAAALTVVAAAFLPLAWAAWRVSGAEAVPGRAFEGMLPALRDLLRVYTLGWPSWDSRWTAAVAVSAGVLALLGCVVPLTESEKRAGGAFLAVWLGGVILVGGFLLSRDRRVFAEARYHILLVPALCLAWGRVLSWSWAWRRPAGLAGAVLVLGITLGALPFDWAPENRREAWRETAAFVESYTGSNDAVVIQADYVHVAFERYYHGPGKVFFPFTDRVTDPARVDPPLAGLAAFDTVWVVQSHHQDLDPGNLVLGWFAARYPLITEVYPAGIAVHGFAQHYRTAELPAGKLQPAGGLRPLEGPPTLAGLRLWSCDYHPSELWAWDDLFHPPSAWLHVTTYWSAGDSRPAVDIHPRVRLVDAAGQVWGESLTRDNDVFRVWPSSRWVPGEFVRADHDVNLNPVTPQGKYRVIVEVPGSEDKVVCGDVKISQSAPTRP
jgi:hypothetical protein